MQRVEDFFDAVDDARLRWARELSELKRISLTSAKADPLYVMSKSVAVLCYAAWEGYYNQCVQTYVEYLRGRDLLISDVHWQLLIGVLGAEFNKLRDRNHSDAAKIEFVDSLPTRLNCKFQDFDMSVVAAKSNLNFDRLSSNLRKLGLSPDIFEVYRLRIDRELVGWRHAVAHGESPDLSAMDVNVHITFTSEMLLNLSGSFQSAILRHI